MDVCHNWEGLNSPPAAPEIKKKNNILLIIILQLCDKTEGTVQSKEQLYNIYEAFLTEH